MATKTKKIVYLFKDKLGTGKGEFRVPQQTSWAECHLMARLQPDFLRVLEIGRVCLSVCSPGPGY